MVAEGVGRPWEGPLNRIDHAVLWVERPIVRLSGSQRLNPLPHAGTISVFLLALVTVSGLYITLFYEFGFIASYDSVARMEGHAIQRVVRAVHRYASAALVVATLVHALRILTARRFTGRARRWRWASGVGTLAIVWMAGVTGYWLVWDVRADAISEILIRLTAATGPGARLAVRELLSPTATGSTTLLVIWFVHLGLTAVIGYLTYRHLRRTQLSWLPPRHWMTLMAGAVLLVSVALPVGMLDAADSTVLVGEMPLDPFVLFLLPPLLSDFRLVALAGGVCALVLALVLPRLLDRSDPAVVEVDDDACTGCDLCVVDCPYLALSMSPTPKPTQAGDSERKRRIAVVDADLCVGCGICLGSCSFGALTLDGAPSLDAIEPAGRSVAIVCDRHLGPDGPNSTTTATEAETEAVVVGVRCAGMFNPATVTTLKDQGASNVQLIGCAPADCRYGIGNQLASERLAGTRSPHLPRRLSGAVAEDWIAPAGLAAALRNPGKHPSADGSTTPARLESLVGAGLVVLASVAATGVATLAPFRPASDKASIRLVVDHQPGAILEAEGANAAPAGQPIVAAITVDGELRAQRELSDGSKTAIRVIDVDVAPGSVDLDVSLRDGDATTLLFSDRVDLGAGRRIVVSGRDVPATPGVAEGRDVFNSRTAGACNVCHSVTVGDDGVGPSLAGIGTRAGDRVRGLDADGYLRQSILLPDQYVVPGFPAGQMLPIYRDRLSEQELEALLTYLLSLKE